MLPYICHVNSQAVSYICCFCYNLTLFCTSCTVASFCPDDVIRRLLLNASDFARLFDNRSAALLLLGSATSHVEKEKMSSGLYDDCFPALAKFRLICGSCHYMKVTRHSNMHAPRQTFQQQKINDLAQYYAIAGREEKQAVTVTSCCAVL